MDVLKINDDDDDDEGLQNQTSKFFDVPSFSRSGTYKIMFHAETFLRKIISQIFHLSFI